jgi:hypothetical protein
MLWLAMSDGRLCSTLTEQAGLSCAGQALSAPGGMDRIRAMMGVCPQFDILWSELTGWEHMLLYGNIKASFPQEPFFYGKLMSIPRLFWCNLQVSSRFCASHRVINLHTP